jgi:flagellar basal body-associated protein FliL
MTDERAAPSRQAVAAKTNQKSGTNKLVLGVAAAVILAIGGGWLYVHGQTGTARAVEPETKGFPVVHLEPFVTNLAGIANDNGYLRLTVDLSVEKEEGESEKKEAGKANPDKIPVSLLRDTILQVIATRTGEELLTAGGKNKLKVDLLKALQERAPGTGIREIYFTDFLVQR